MLKTFRDFHYVPELSLSAGAAFLLPGMAFVGAFLLFIMEPLVGRLLAPFFGGAIHVWLTSMMFFQAMLFIGYLYAYLLARRLGRWHLIIIVLPLINLPLKIASVYAPTMPILALLSNLLIHIALPFAVLSTTAIVAQLWLVYSHLPKAKNPYPLYAASNAGSLTALLGYPFLIEPFLGLRAQSFFWTIGYLGYILLVILAWYAIHPELRSNLEAPRNLPPSTGINTPKASDYIWWLWLSFLPSGLLLAITNHIASEVGSFPLIWIAPLALYLASFIITFRTDGGVPKLLVKFWPVILVMGIIFSLLSNLSFLSIGVHLFVFFIACLYGNGELYERRPLANYLTNYYLVISFGGWLGGIFVSLIAPKILSGLFEYPLIFLLLCLTIAWTQNRYFISWWHQETLLFRISYILTIGFIVLVVSSRGIKYLERNEKCIHSHRSFYGIYKVLDLPPGEGLPEGFRVLKHGHTWHGGEFLDPKYAGESTTYYFSQGAIGDVFELVPSPRKIAAIGLGAGTIATYTKPNDSLTFFEIDPANEPIARSYFSYLDHALGSVGIISGDGRLSLLEAAKNKLKYDLIIIDAFSGDGIPAHLLTREAIEIYLNCLTDDGLLLFHISNRYYNLSSIIEATSNELNLFGCFNIRSARSPLKKYDINPRCVVLSKKFQPLQPLLKHDWIAFGAEDGLKKVSPWTDDYTNIIDPLLAQIMKSDSTKKE